MNFQMMLALFFVASATGARDIKTGSSHSRKLQGCVGVINCALPSPISIPTVRVPAPIANQFTPMPVPQRPIPAAPRQESSGSSSKNNQNANNKENAVISRAAPGTGNVNCANSNTNSCRNAPGAQTGRGTQYNGGKGDNGDGKYDVVNSNNCNPRTHHACCHHKSGRWSRETVCDGSAECCNGAAG